MVITWHLSRLPVAFALAAVDGIRRGLHAAVAAPAHAYVGDPRRVAPSACVSPELGALVPCTRGGREGVQLLRRSELWQAPKRFIFYATYGR